MPNYIVNKRSFSNLTRLDAAEWMYLEGRHLPQLLQAEITAKFVLECTTSEADMRECLLSCPGKCKLLLLQHVHNSITMIYLRTRQEQACQCYSGKILYTVLI